MSFTRAWDETSPTNSLLVSQVDDQFRNLKVDLRERLAVEHDAAATEGASTTIGQHKKGSAKVGFGIATSRPPVNATNHGSVYAATDTKHITYDNGTSWLPFGTARAFFVQAAEPTALATGDIWIQTEA